MTLKESIIKFESVYQKYLNPNGSLNREGYKLLCRLEANLTFDKYHEYEKYHLSPRLSKYWNNPSEDQEYKKAWKQAREMIKA